MPPPLDPTKQKKAVKVQPFSELLASANPGKALSSWNGIKVYVVDPKTGKVLVNAGGEATAKDVQQMMHDKSVHAYNRMVKKMEMGELSRERVAAFEQAFLPEWTNNPSLKAQDIARVIAQKEMGLQLRVDAEAKINALARSKHGISPAIRDQILCEILKPMTLPGNPTRPTHVTQRQ